MDVQSQQQRHYNNVHGHSSVVFIVDFNRCLYIKSTVFTADFEYFLSPFKKLHHFHVVLF